MKICFYTVKLKSNVKDKRIYTLTKKKKQERNQNDTCIWSCQYYVLNLLRTAGLIQGKIIAIFGNVNA